MVGTTLNGRKRGIALGDKKKYATPTNEDLGQTCTWSKLVAAYLPVARLTILDRLVLCFVPFHGDKQIFIYIKGNTIKLTSV